MNTISLKKLFYFEKTPLNLLMAFITVALLGAFAAGAFCRVPAAGQVVDPRAAVSVADRGLSGRAVAGEGA